MKIYSQKQLGIKNRKGGFVDYGWYDGCNYFQGTFGDYGVIHPMCEDGVSIVDRIRFLLKKLSL